MMCEFIHQYRIVFSIVKFNIYKWSLKLYTEPKYMDLDYILIVLVVFILSSSLHSLYRHLKLQEDKIGKREEVEQGVY